MQLAHPGTGEALARAAYLTNARGRICFAQVLIHPPKQIQVTAPVGFELGVGAETQMRLMLSNGRQSDPLRALVTARYRSPQGERYGLELLATAAERAAMHPEVRTAFELRRTRRLRVPEGTPVLLSNIAGQLYRGSLLDVSDGGCAALLPTAADLELLGVDEVEVSFRLGPRQTGFSLIADIPRRQLVGGGVLYGLRFCEDRDEEHRARLQRLLERVTPA